MKKRVLHLGIGSEKALSGLGRVGGLICSGAARYLWGSCTGSLRVAKEFYDENSSLRLEAYCKGLGRKLFPKAGLNHESGDYLYSLLYREHQASRLVVFQTLILHRHPRTLKLQTANPDTGFRG